MNSEIKQQHDRLKEEIRVVSAVFARKQADSPQSHWTDFCSSCVFIKFYQDANRKQQAYNNAANFLEQSKSEVRERGLDTKILAKVEDEFIKLGQLMQSVSAEASESNVNNMKI